ncbi:hypothetical protein IU436_28910 [Nocardia farcinica]|uniref:hypothetical protein n=1 Tax=Nocardia TaxID=1817 RepID=UPI001894BCC2|nr:MULTISPECIES: hypothetical protein [Nocardia]MBF6215690.1 hypothetical protein [Nocardia puris]MBF6422658.1 hypothetical protein [Nocardia farcinica]MBF6434348.1 hypothetical protein [Nocardia farcinica]MBF6505433.1 hypothetical protein [Nocardia farcinica]
MNTSPGTTKCRSPKHRTAPATATAGHRRGKPTAGLPLPIRLRQFPTRVLIRLLRVHHPISTGGRCARCGQRYPAGSQICHTSRAIYDELARRRHYLIVRSQQPTPCKQNPHMWQVDGDDALRWEAVMKLCKKSCPILAQCQQQLEQQLAAKEPPISMIQAGRAFNDHGAEITAHLYFSAAMQAVANLRTSRPSRPSRNTKETADQMGSVQFARDHQGRQWALMAVDGEILAKRWPSPDAPAPVADVIAVEGPLILEPLHPADEQLVDAAEAAVRRLYAFRAPSGDLPGSAALAVHATDVEQRRWALVVVGGQIRARLVRGTCKPAVMTVSDLVDAYGPLTLAPTRLARNQIEFAQAEAV